jgi:AraC-like DNA-binding protein
MSDGSGLKDSETSRCREGPQGLADRHALFAELSKSITERFERLTGLVAVLATVDPHDESTATSFLSAPVHPLCADVPDREACRQSWHTHLAELALRAEVNRHKCRFGKLCAVVPVTWHRRCVAACQLVCPESMEAEAFEHSVEFLDVLIENFVARHGDSLSRLRIPDEKAPDGRPHGDITHNEKGTKPPLNPKVRDAIDYIDEQVRAIDLNATKVARQLEINATYLAHLFAEQVGIRMNRYIAIRRIELAEKLLAATNWQVKRIARESGYANPDWFSHVFHSHTGLTPGEYRRKLRVDNAGPPSDSGPVPM